MDFAEQVGKIIGSLIQFFLAVSTWSYILASYWNREEPPTLILGVGAALLAKYGLDKVVPVVRKALGAYFGERK